MGPCHLTQEILPYGAACPSTALAKVVACRQHPTAPPISPFPSAVGRLGVFRPPQGSKQSAKRKDLTRWVRCPGIGPKDGLMLANGKTQMSWASSLAHVMHVYNYMYIHTCILYMYRLYIYIIYNIIYTCFCSSLPLEKNRRHGRCFFHFFYHRVNPGGNSATGHLRAVDIC